MPENQINSWGDLVKLLKKKQLEANNKSETNNKAPQVKESAPTLSKDEVYEVKKETPTNSVIDLFSDVELEEVHVDSIADGLVLSLSNTGKVDIPYIAKISSSTLDEVIKELEDSIYLNPRTFNGNIYEGYESKDQYLSGNINIKLQEAITANNKYHGLFKSNVSALKELKKTFTYIYADDIHVTLGTSWISTTLIESFIYEVLKYRCHVLHDDKSGSWSIESSWWKGGVILTQTFGTKRMNAIDLIESALNQTTIVIKDEDKSIVSKKKVYKRNDKETLLAIEKQQLIIDAFKKWIKGTPTRRNIIEKLYNANYGNNYVRKYDGSYLKMPGMSKDITLFDYQKNAIARIIFSPNTLLAHDVGSGKTFEMVGAGHELKRMHLSKKNMYVVPNNVLLQWKQMYNRMYPFENILVVEPKKFTPSNRNNVLNDIIYNDYDAIIISYSSFNLIPLSPDELRIKVDEQYQNNIKAMTNANSQTTTVKRRRTLYLKGKYQDEINKLGEKDPNIIYFDDLGIDRLFIDEAHNFKNVPLDTNIKALGIHSNGSKECEMMMEKVHYIQRKNNGGGVVFATGTPITNSLSDIYTIQKYLQSAELSMLNLDSFNSWIANFAERQQEFEIDVDTQNFRMASRYSKFHNLPELSSMLANIADFHHIDKDNDLPDFNGYKDIVLDQTKEFENFLKTISKRADLIRNKKPMTFNDPHDKDRKIKDNMLLITHDGRDAALDLRILNSNKYHFNENSKSYQCALKVKEIYDTTMEIKGTQIIFCDTSTPKAGFNVYDDIKGHLMNLGIPMEEIAYIHDADTEAKRKRLFADVNNGKVRVLIGSTFKLGLGVNVQTRLYALHHLDIPWRPSDMVQREGRILRPGNTNEEIFIYRYITKQSFDAYSWQLLETKQNFISKILNGNVKHRDDNDIDDSVLSYAEVKALAVGSPLIKERVVTNNEINRLLSLQSKFYEERSALKERVKYVKEHTSKWLDEINLVSKDVEYVNSIHIDTAKEEDEGLSADQKESNANERKRLRNLVYTEIVANTNSSERKVILDDYLGFKVINPPYQITTTGDYSVIIERNFEYKVKIGNSATGVLIRIRNFIATLPDYLNELKARYQVNLKELRNAEKELKKPDTYEDEIVRLKNLLRDIDFKLGVNK